MTGEREILTYRAVARIAFGSSVLGRYLMTGEREILTYRAVARIAL
jgi:hypothetical protein